MPRRPRNPEDQAMLPIFTEGELLIAVRSFKSKKAPGPDGLPAEVLKAAVEGHTDLFLKMYNDCLQAGVFPKRWKQARLVLIDKGKGGPVDNPSSYRPLCILDSAGKLLEKLLRPRLHAAVQAAGDLSNSQYGFRKGRSTIQAIQEVIEAARATERGNHFSRPICLLVTLDVKNAFNSLRWVDVLRALEHDFNIPYYLLKIMEDYLDDRSLLYTTTNGPTSRKVTSGAAQGSILGPDIWNISYDGILRIKMPDGTFLVGYADDIVAVITGRNVEIAQMLLNQVMRRIRSWMNDHGLDLALAKTEIVLITKKHIPVIRHMQVEAASVETKTSIKYLGMKIDSKLAFWEEISTRADKAARIVASLNRVMANVGGPRPCKRRLLLHTAESVMLYGSEIWADALRFEKYRRRMAAVQRRGALRIVSAYRTVSEPAVLVIAGVIPIDLLAQERKTIHNTPVEVRTIARKLARINSIRLWQDRWEREPRGRWTSRLIPQLDIWINREHGEVNYYLTQMFTGHGYFRAFLHKIGKAVDPRCLSCGSENDNAFHTFFECEIWSVWRAPLEERLGRLNPDTVVRVMLSSEEAWAEVASCIETTLREKKVVLDGGIA